MSAMESATLLRRQVTSHLVDWLTCGAMSTRKFIRGQDKVTEPREEGEVPAMSDPTVVWWVCGQVLRKGQWQRSRTGSPHQALGMAAARFPGLPGLYSSLSIRAMSAAPGLLAHSPTWTVSSSPSRAAAHAAARGLVPGRTPRRRISRKFYIEKRPPGGECA